LPAPDDNALELYNFVPALAQSLRAKPAHDLLPEPWFGVRRLCLAGLQALRRADNDRQVSRSTMNGHTGHHRHGRERPPGRSREAGWPLSAQAIRRDGIRP